ncbi:MAG: S9 family peptidase, partial [Halobacteria archaeon]|nr:S9 family peptidase [Halobacteria archaeon]
MDGYGIERYLNIRSAYSPSFGPEGKLAFLMDTTGTAQVWSLDEPLSWPKQLTFYDESVSFASFSPERPELVFGMDEGGNERVQLYRLSRDGSEVTPLTDRPEAKHMWGGWSNDGDMFAFTSNRRDESVFDVYVQGRDSDDPELVHESDGWYNVAGWSPDDGRLVLSESHSNFDQDLYVLDIGSGNVEHVTPHDGEVRYRSVNWGPEGDSLYLVTDEGSDTLYLGRLDLDTLELETVVEGGDWNVGGVNLDHENRRLVYGR